MQLLHQQSEEVLFSCFVTTLNTAFWKLPHIGRWRIWEWKWNFNIPTPLRCTCRFFHVSSDDNISFDPITPCSMGTSQSHYKPVRCQLSFSTSDDEEILTVDITSTSSTTPPQHPMGFAQQPHFKCILTLYDDLGEEKQEEEDFQTVSLDNSPWVIEEIPDRHLCIHKHSLSHQLCPYWCPYMEYTPILYHDTLNLSDISEFEDLITTSSNEDILGLDDKIGYWNI